MNSHAENPNTEHEVKPIVVPLHEEEMKRGLLQKWKEKRAQSKLRSKIKQREKKKSLLRQTPLILPFLNITDDYILMKDGYMELYQVESKDLYTRNDGDLEFLLFGLARLYRSYYDPIKIIGMNFPSNTSTQQRYWEKKLDSATDPIRIQYIHRKLFEFKYLEKERTNREFFLFVYGEDQQQLSERKIQLERVMQQVFFLKQIDKEKKQDVLFVLNNQNTKL